MIFPGRVRCALSSKDVLTSYSIGIALRVVRKIAAITRGTTPESDQAFGIVAGVLESLLK